MTAIWSAALSTDIRDVTGAVSCPVTVITGDLDATCPREQAEEMTALLGGRLRLLAGLGHLPMLEAPRVLVEALEEHLAGTV